MYLMEANYTRQADFENVAWKNKNILCAESLV